MLEILLVLIGGYFFVQITGYMIHWMLHRRQLGPVHRAHSEHHTQQYTPSNYLSDKYKPTSGSHQPVFYYAPPALVVVALSFWIFSPLVAALFTAELALIAGANDWLHTQLHVKGHWLERYGWFWRLRDLHWHHHVDDTKNFGIFFWLTDRVFKTFQEPQQTPSYYLPEEDTQPRRPVLVAAAVAAEQPPPL